MNYGVKYWLWKIKNLFQIHVFILVKFEVEDQFIGHRNQSYYKIKSRSCFHFRENPNFLIDKSQVHLKMIENAH